MEPAFFETYGNQFQHAWEVFTEDKTRFNLNFRNNIYNPIIVDDWEFLEQKYHLPEYVEVCLGHLGEKNSNSLGSRH